jgi:hypothetical protein
MQLFIPSKSFPYIDTYMSSKDGKSNVWQPTHSSLITWGSQSKYTEGLQTNSIFFSVYVGREDGQKEGTEKEKTRREEDCNIR